MAVIRRWGGVVVAVLGIALCVASVSQLLGAAYELRVYGSPHGILDLQRARTPAAARTILETWAQPAPAGLFERARAHAAWDFAFFGGLGLVLLGVAVALRPRLATARAQAGIGLWSRRIAWGCEQLLGLIAPVVALSIGLGAIAAVMHVRLLNRALADGPAVAAGAGVMVATVLGHGRIRLLVFAVVVVTASGLCLLSLNRSERVRQFLVIVRVCRVGLLTVIAVGVGLVVPDQLLDAFRTLAESSLWQIVFTEAVLLVWAVTVWYTTRFLLNVNFETDPTFQPGAPYYPGERHLPAILGTGAVLAFAIGAFRAWWATADSAETDYPWLLAIAVFNAAFGLAWWLVPQLRRGLAMMSRPLNRARGLPFQAMPPSVKRVVVVSVVVAGILWIAVFFSLQTTAPYLGTVALLLGAAITVTLAGTLLVWHGERARLPALTIVAALALVFSFTNDNHEVRRLPGAAVPSGERVDIHEHVKRWHAGIRAKYPGQEHPLFIVTAAGGGIRAAYWTAAVLARLQDMNPAFADHTLLVSGVSGGSLGALVFANLVDTTPGGSPPTACTAKGRYQALASSILSRDFLAPTAASMLYGDFLARLLPFSFLSDRAEALEVAWERAWDDVKAAPPAGITGPLWERNPFERSFDALLPRTREGRLPLMLLNGTIVESGTRILVSHLAHPGEFRGDLEHAFDHRAAPMRMSTAALMSARFTYVSPAGTYAPGTHVVDGGYFENSGVVTALQWWAQIRRLVDRDLRAEHPSHRIRAVFLYIDNNPPPSDRERAAAQRTPRPARMESFDRTPGVLPELRPPVDALLNAREAHAVEARYRAQRMFREEADKAFIAIDTNVVPPNTRRLRLDSAPLGWVLSARTRTILDDALCANQGKLDDIVGLLAASAEGKRR
jgi:hypothetical protein